MAANKIDLTKTYCPVWTYKISAGNNKAKARIEYKDDYDGWIGRAPEIDSAHPDIPGMVLVDLDMERLEGGQAMVKLEYESWSIEANYPGRPAGDPVKRYDFELPEREEHILTHSRYADLSDTERTALLAISNGQEEDRNGASYEAQVTTDLGKNALEKIRKGRTHFLQSGFTWIERFSTDDLSDVQMNDGCEIMDPPGPHPTPAEDRDFLYLGAVGRNSEDGKTWEVERRWMLSDKNGWDDLYDPGYTP